MQVRLVNPEDIEAVYWHDSFLEETTCSICSHKEWSSWRAEIKQGIEIPICRNCAQNFHSRECADSSLQKRRGS
ncbi:MAG: hypothetical protein NWE91_02780 [Candidatus Bathyarchaeota archaeon]|nr:hypothetical protein [Candidatus Bathyarchaeota archaeon]